MIIHNTIKNVKIERADGTIEDLGEKTIVSEWTYNTLTIIFDPPLPPMYNGDSLIFSGEPFWEIK